MQTSTTSPRRTGTTAVHSLHRFVFSVPDLDKAADFYEAFGLVNQYRHPSRVQTILRRSSHAGLQGSSPSQMRWITPSLSITKVVRLASLMTGIRTPYSRETVFRSSLRIGNVTPSALAKALFRDWLSTLIPITCAPACSNLAISA